MGLYSEFARANPQREDELQTRIQSVFTHAADPNEDNRHVRTWKHLQWMFPPTVEGTASLAAEVAGSDGDFSHTAELEIEIKTELYKREGVPGVINSPLGPEIAHHYALLFGLLCDAVAKDLLEDMYDPLDRSQIPLPPLKMEREDHDDSCYGCGFSFSTGLYGSDWVMYCCGYETTMRNGAVLCCKTSWHGRCAGLLWAPGDDTRFIGLCGHADCMSSGDAQQMAVDAIAEAEAKDHELQVNACTCEYIYHGHVYVHICVGVGVCRYAHMYVYMHVCVFRLLAGKLRCIRAPLWGIQLHGWSKVC